MHHCTEVCLCHPVAVLEDAGKKLQIQRDLEGYLLVHLLLFIK